MTSNSTYRFYLNPRWIVSLFWAFIASYSSYGQESLNFEHINAVHGLSNNTIECIFQDSKGFMWFGTRDGLNRYDGYQINIYRNTPDDSTSLSDNYITSIYEDYRGGLWVGTLNGLNRYDWQSNQFKRYKHRPTDKRSLNSNHISSIVEYQHQLWIGTHDGGLHVLESDGENFEQYRHTAHKSNSLINDQVNCLYVDGANRLWIGTQQGLSLWNDKKKEFISYGHTLRGEGKPEITAIADDNKGKLWLGTQNNGLCFFDTTEKQYISGPATDHIPSDLIRAIICDQKKQIWLGSVNGGLSFFGRDKKHADNYTNDPNNPKSLSQRTVSALFEDRQGNLWIGTHRGGVNLYSPNALKFQLFRKSYVSNSLTYNDVRTFCEDHEGRLWIGTDGGGLDLYDRKSKRFTHFKSDSKSPSSLSSDAVLHIMEDRQQRLWISTWGGGLNHFDPKTGRFKSYRQESTQPYSISSNYVQKTFEDSKGNLWVATYFGGLNLFDPARGTFTPFTKGKDKQSSLFGNNVVNIEEDTEGNLWFATDDGGLNRYHPGTGIISHYFHKTEKMPDIRILFQDTKGRLWVGQNGLYLFDRDQEDFKLYTERANLDKALIKGILEDKGGNLWISTANGIVKFHPETENFRIYNINDGLQDLEFEANAYLKLRDGTFLFGGINGFNLFHPENISINHTKAHLYITALELFNKKIAPGQKGSPLASDIIVTKQLNLDHTQSSFSLTFAYLNYTASKNNEYAYLLEGFDQDWVYTQNERKATYTNLPPGEYNFRVKASNNDGIWNENETTLRIHISPPFWKTWWFNTVGLLALLLISYKWLQAKRRSEKRRFEENKKEELHQLQLQFFTNISHEFRTPLSLIIGPIERLLNDDRPKLLKRSHELIYRNAKRLMGLIDELMDFRQAETGGFRLKVQQTNIPHFIHEITEDFKLLAEHNDIRFTVNINIPAAESEYWLDCNLLEKILLNLLNNAFKYSPPEGQIQLQVYQHVAHLKPAFGNELHIANGYKAKAYLYFVVRDNGIGISRESIKHLFERYYRIADYHMGSGVGLAFVRSLTLLHKGEITVYSERNKGSEFVIALPFLREDYEVHEIQVLPPTTYSIQGKQPIFPPIALQEQNKMPKQGLPRILLVEDHTELRQFLRESLADQYQIWEAADGLEALEILNDKLPDIIISDIMMPNLNGNILCQKVKSQSASHHIPFIMLTAKNDDTSQVFGMNLGADYYFSKPVNISVLKLTIRNVLIQRATLKRKLVRNDQFEAIQKIDKIKERSFVEKLIKIIEKNLSNPSLDIDFLCKETGMSRSKLYQKVKESTNQPIGDLIRSIRLKHAVYLMTHEDMTIVEVMFRIGIQTQSYFTKAFKKEFGKTPSQYIQDTKKQVP